MFSNCSNFIAGCMLSLTFSSLPFFPSSKTTFFYSFFSGNRKIVSVAHLASMSCTYILELAKLSCSVKGTGPNEYISTRFLNNSVPEKKYKFLINPHRQKHHLFSCPPNSPPNFDFKSWDDFLILVLGSFPF